MFGKKKKYFADVDVSGYLSSETVDKIIKGQREIEKAMFTGKLEEVLHPKSIKIHTFSTNSGYYEDAIDWTLENDTFIKKWIDSETECMYSLILFPNNEPERVFVTRDIFSKIYKYRYDDCEDLL